MKQILIFGSGGHAKVVTDVIEKQGLYNIAGTIDKGDEAKVAARGIKRGIIAIGDNAIRESVASQITQLVSDFEFVTVIHPSAQISKNVELSAGTVVMAGACINAYARIGAHGIVNTRASIDHNCVLQDFCSVAPGATLGGDVKMGRGAAVALGASVIQRISIGAHSVIGAGAVVVSDIPDGVVAYGVPCRVIRKVPQ